jgi:hypothetical protein
MSATKTDHGQMAEPRRALLARRAEGGCPHVISARSMGVGEGSMPEPGVVARICHQSSANRIVDHILYFLIKALRRPDHMVERFSLPNVPCSSQRPVDLVGGNPFDRICDLRKRIDLRRLDIHQRREDHMHVVWHDYDGTEIDAPAVVVQAAIQHDVPEALRKNPFLVGTERQEVRLAVPLQMRKLATIEGLRHKRSRGDSRPRLSGGAQLR